MQGKGKRTTSAADIKNLNIENPTLNNKIANKTIKIIVRILISGHPF